MTKEKLIELATAYDQILGQKHVTAASQASRESSPPREHLNDAQSARLQWKADNLSHARHMVGEVMKLAEAGDVPKANRWFGFVQGVLWTMGIFTINEMRAHNS